MSITHTGRRDGGSIGAKPLLEGLAGITWALLQRGAMLPKEDKQAQTITS